MKSLFNAPRQPIMTRSELRSMSYQCEMPRNDPSSNGHNSIDHSLNANKSPGAGSRARVISHDDCISGCESTKADTEYDKTYQSHALSQSPTQPTLPKEEGDEELSSIAESPQIPNILKEVRTEDIRSIMTRIEADESEDERLSKELDAAREYLKLRKRKRDQALDYLIEKRTDDLKEYLKKRKN
jgi:hypothetical protein